MSGLRTPQRCLVVEDSPAMRQLLVFALARLPSLEVVEASDGADALRKLVGVTYDLIVTDLNMPILDGLKLIHRVRHDPVHREVPIVVVTTEIGDEDRRRALELGANAYITKPIQAAKMLAAASELLGR